MAIDTIYKRNRSIQMQHFRPPRNIGGLAMTIQLTTVRWFYWCY